MSRWLGLLREATTPADRAVLVLAWAGMIALAAHAYRAPAGEEAVVVVGDQVARRVSLEGERTLTVQGAQGPAKLRVAHGGIRFVHSPCDAKRCLRAGWQTRAGDSAACVPNRVLIRVSGDSDSDSDRDAVNY